MNALTPQLNASDINVAELTLPTDTVAVKTLLLDLGTDTGWALVDQRSPMKSGTICLAMDEELELQRQEGRERTLDIRFTRLYEFIAEHIGEGVGRIVFEDVEFASTRMQTQLWASLRTAIWAAAHLNPGVRVFGVPVATLKQFATGNGHVQKLEMAKALANFRPGGYSLLDDGRLITPDGHFADHNEVDAIWLAYYTQSVDRGERGFLPVYHRKLLEVAERRQKKAQRRQTAKAKKTAALVNAKLQKEAIRDALRSLDRCCGVFRKLDRRRATCPKCGSRVALPEIYISSSTAGTPGSTQYAASAVAHPDPSTARPLAHFSRAEAKPSERPA
jgi:hypothetical protein